MSQKKGVAASIIIIVLLIAAMAALWVSVSVDPNRQVSYSLTADSNEAVSIKVVTGEGWENADKTQMAMYGTQYDGTIVNKTGSDITDWSITFEVPQFSYMDSTWNGVYTVEENVVTVDYVDYNQLIEDGASITFGFVMYTPEPITLTDFTFTAQSIRAIYDEPLFWVLALAIFTMIVIIITNIVASVKYRRMQDKLGIYREVTEQALRVFAGTIDAKDEYTSDHSYRVAVYSRMLAKRLGMSEEEQENIYYIALLHDIGKIAVPDSILTKRAHLAAEEYEQIRQHTTAGGNILAGFSAVPGASDGARYHHERYDGKGYVTGLSGKKIPLCARIITVADAYDAMSSARCYRPELEREKILSELEEGKGTQFDPDIVVHMIAMINENAVPMKEEN